MQPILLLRSLRPGAIYLGGRFAGEVDADRELILPVAAQGVQILELHPYDDSVPLARRLVFAGGVPVADAWGGLSGIHAVVWPGGMVEVEISDAPQIEEMPPPRMLGELEVYEKDTENGRLIIVRRAGHELLRVAGREAMLRADGSVYVVEDLNDEVGHARAVVYMPGAEGYEAVSVDMLWSNGMPMWPETAEGCAVATLQAALLGLTGEAGGYLAPGYALESVPVNILIDGYDACTRMRFPAPGSESAVALLKLEGENLFRATPVFYRASLSGGMQGSYKIEHFAVR